MNSIRSIAPLVVQNVKAEVVARLAHYGQKEESSGDDYMHHIERVVALVDNDEERAVAWLHDVIEDSPDVFGEDADEKLRLVVSDAVAEAVFLLTRGWHLSPDAPYAEYIDHICASGNRLAIAVKIADLRDHLRPTCPARLRPRYEAALPLLVRAAYSQVSESTGSTTGSTEAEDK